MANPGEKQVDAGATPPEKPGLLSQMAASLKQGWEDLRIGDGHAAAMGRLGLQELRNAFNPSRESIAGSEMGVYGTATQGEIANARDGAGNGPEQENLSMDDLKAAAEKKNEQGKDGPEPDRGMER